MNHLLPAFDHTSATDAGTTADSLGSFLPCEIQTVFAFLGHIRTFMHLQHLQLPLFPNLPRVLHEEGSL